MTGPDTMKANRALRLAELLAIRVPRGDDSARREYAIGRGLSQSRLTQLLKEGFGERAGERLAARFGLRDSRAFDRHPGSSFDGDEKPRTVQEPAVVYGHPASRSLEVAAREIAEAILAAPPEKREAASIAVKLLASAPDQWPEVARILRDLSTPLGGPGSHTGAVRPKKATG